MIGNRNEKKAKDGKGMKRDSGAGAIREGKKKEAKMRELTSAGVPLPLLAVSGTVRAREFKVSCSDRSRRAKS